MASFSRKKGFTIIELLVVIAIMGMLTTAIFLSYRSGQKEYALANAAQKLASDFRKAQTMAISGSRVAGQYCGFGVLINAAADNDQYTFYGDKAPNCNSRKYQNESVDETLETVTLTDGVIIQSSNPSPLDVFYEPPHPTVYNNGNLPAAGWQGTVVLQNQSGTLTKTITVTRGGLITVE